MLFINNERVSLDEAFKKSPQEYANYAKREANLTGAANGGGAYKTRQWGFRADDEVLMGEGDAGVNPEVFWTKQKAYSIPMEGFRQLF